MQSRRFVQPMELDIRLLRTLRAVAEMRSFTGAARKLGLTQSSVSQQISVLERGLGVQLLKRSNKFVGPTTAGEIFRQCARQVLDNLDRVRAMLAERSNSAAGHLSIGAPALFCHWPNDWRSAATASRWLPDGRCAGKSSAASYARSRSERRAYFVSGVSRIITAPN